MIQEPYTDLIGKKIKHIPTGAIFLVKKLDDREDGYYCRPSKEDFIEEGTNSDRNDGFVLIPIYNKFFEVLNDKINWRKEL